MNLETRVGFWWTRDGRLALVSRKEDTGFRDCWRGILFDDEFEDGCEVWSWSDIDESTDSLAEYIGMTYPGVYKRPEEENER